jgi:two-component system nitrate/nitrite response regulator NarL
MRADLAGVAELAPIRVVLIDDDPDVRTLLEVLFELDDRFHLVGSAPDGVRGLDLVRDLVPDAVVVDLEMPGIDGLTVIGAVRSLMLDIRVIVFSAFPDPYTLMDVLQRGADGYLDKAAAWSELLPTLAGLFHGSLQIQ